MLTPTQFELLQTKAQHSDFAASLLSQFERKGTLSPKQVACIERWEDEGSAPRPVTGGSTIALRNVAQMLSQAGEELKWPKFRLLTADGQRVVLSLAGDRARFPGSINVTDGGRYPDNKWFGRISIEGDFDPSRTPQDVVDTLKALDADPEAEWKVQGIRTGECGICGRELTDPVSVERGIGPVCASRVGLG